MNASDKVLRSQGKTMEAGAVRDWLANPGNYWRETDATVGLHALADLDAPALVRLFAAIWTQQEFESTVRGHKDSVLIDWLLGELQPPASSAAEGTQQQLAEAPARECPACGADLVAEPDADGAPGEWFYWCEACEWGLTELEADA